MAGCCDAPSIPTRIVPAPEPSGGGGITVEDESAPLGVFTIFNFLGDGVTAVDAGGGQVNITVPGGIPLGDYASTVGSPLVVSTSLQTFIPAGLVLTAPSTGTYIALMEGEARRTSAANVYLETRFSGGIWQGPFSVNTTRQYWQAHLQNNAHVASGVVQLNAGQQTQVQFRKASALPGTVALIRRRFSIWRVA